MWSKVSGHMGTDYYIRVIGLSIPLATTSLRQWHPCVLTGTCFMQLFCWGGGGAEQCVEPQEKGPFLFVSCLKTSRHQCNTVQPRFPDPFVHRLITTIPHYLPYGIMTLAHVCRGLMNCNYKLLVILINAKFSQNESRVATSIDYKIFLGEYAPRPPLVLVCLRTLLPIKFGLTTWKLLPQALKCYVYM